VIAATAPIETPPKKKKKNLVGQLCRVIGDNRAVQHCDVAGGLADYRGIGSSFSTIPIIAAIYVPRGHATGLQPAAAIVAAWLGTLPRSVDAAACV